MLTTTENGDFLVAGNPIKISGYDDYPSGVRPNTPLLNEHGEAIRNEVAEMLAEQKAKL